MRPYYTAGTLPPHPRYQILVPTPRFCLGYFFFSSSFPSDSEFRVAVGALLRISSDGRADDIAPVGARARLDIENATVGALVDDLLREADADVLWPPMGQRSPQGNTDKVGAMWFEAANTRRRRCGVCKLEWPLGKDPSQQGRGTNNMVLEPAQFLR